MKGFRIAVPGLGGKTTFKRKNQVGVIDVDDAHKLIARGLNIPATRFKRAWRLEPGEWKRWEELLESYLTERLNQGDIVLVHAQDPKADALVIPEASEYMARADRIGSELGLTDDQLSIVRRLSAAVAQLRSVLARRGVPIFRDIESAVVALRRSRGDPENGEPESGQSGA